MTQGVNVADGLTARELTKLSAFELGQELNKIDSDVEAFTRTAATAQRALAEAEVRVLYQPEDIDSKAQVKIQRALFTSAKLQLSQLSKRQSRIQTLLRTMP